MWFSTDCYAITETYQTCKAPTTADTPEIAKTQCVFVSPIKCMLRWRAQVKVQLSHLLRLIGFRIAKYPVFDLDFGLIKLRVRTSLHSPKITTIQANTESNRFFVNSRNVLCRVESETPTWYFVVTDSADSFLFCRHAN